MEKNFNFSFCFSLSRWLAETRPINPKSVRIGEPLGSMRILESLRFPWEMLFSFRKSNPLIIEMKISDI